MQENTIKYKTFQFSLEVIKLYKRLLETKEFVLSKQLLRSGTAIGALVREAEYAESKLDFIHKMAISLKEANETGYWLELLYQSDYIEKSSFETLLSSAEEIIKILTAIINTSKHNLKKSN